MQGHINLCDILAEHGEGYIARNKLKGQEKGIVRLLSACRSSALGSHFESCSQCGYLGKSYNSCRNRHCPQCQQKDKQKWLEKRMDELLPVGYYHLVFTIPHQLNRLCLQNKKAMYGILFKAASQTVLELARDTKHLGGDTGLIAVLHTWGQNMMEHPHLHCIMPAGGLSFDRGHWVHAGKKDGFFVYYKVLSRKFRGKFLDLLQQAFEKGQLGPIGTMPGPDSKKKFEALMDRLYKMDWVVNVQKPFGDPEKVLEYLSRYVFRIAITNRRIIEVKDGKVLFSWKDYRTGQFRKMRTGIDEFIRRFLLHILPQGFFKVRYYGIFSSRHRKKNIERAKGLLEQEQENKRLEDIEDGVPPLKRDHAFWDEIWPQVKQYRQPNCPACKKGRLRFAGLVPRE